MNATEILKSIKTFDDIIMELNDEQEIYAEDGNVWYPFIVNGLGVELGVSFGSNFNMSISPKNNKELFMWIMDELYYIICDDDLSDEISRIKDLWPERNPNFYYPLLECLDVRNSDIHGKGLFAIEDIHADKDLGISHWLSIGHYELEEPIRTPLGGFFNHNDEDPNCVVVRREEEEFTVLHLVATRDIASGEELTVKYTFYNPKENEQN